MIYVVVIVVVLAYAARLLGAEEEKGIFDKVQDRIASAPFEREQALPPPALEALDHAAIRGWVNHARYADTWSLRRAVLNDTVSG